MYNVWTKDNQENVVGDKARICRQLAVFIYHDQCKKVGLPDDNFDQTTLLLRMYFAEISVPEEYGFHP